MTLEEQTRKYVEENEQLIRIAYKSTYGFAKIGLIGGNVIVDYDDSFVLLDERMNHRFSDIGYTIVQLDEGKADIIPDRKGRSR